MSIAEMDTGFQSDHGDKDHGVCAWYILVFFLKDDLTIVFMFFLISILIKQTKVLLICCSKFLVYAKTARTLTGTMLFLDSVKETYTMLSAISIPQNTRCLILK